MGKSRNAGVSFRPEEIVQFRTRAGVRDQGSLTRYFRRLAEQDALGDIQLTGYAESVLADLAKTYAGFLAPQLGKQLAERGADQPRLLHDMLIQLSDYFAAGGRIADLMIGSRAQFAAATYPERQQPNRPATKTEAKQRQRAQAATAPADPSANEDPATVTRAARPLRTTAADAITGAIVQALEPSAPPVQPSSPQPGTAPQKAPSQKHSAQE